MRYGLFDGGRLGLVRGETVYDISALVPEPGKDGRLSALIRLSDAKEFPPPPGWAELLATTPVHHLADVAWEAPLPRPGKIMGAPANYFEHIDEMVGSKSILEWGLFLKASSSVIGPEQTIELPYSDQRTDHEGELAVVIGRAGRNIPLESALDHVFGYTCILDITVRATEDRSTRKSFDTFSPLGPTIVTADEIVDPGSLKLALTVNGETRQSSNTANMIYGVRELIAYASSVMTLEPGDVIATGTPSGVGPIVDGDVVTVTIESVGSLTVDVSARSAIRYADRPGPKTALKREARFVAEG